MQQASRIAIIGLLALMQLFAPLVHAHAGGGQGFGAIHVPGLEFLAKADRAYAQSSTGKGESFDVIVGLAPGMKIPDGHVSPVPDAGFTLPPRFRLTAGLPTGREFPPPFSFAAIPRQAWLKPSPRASPGQAGHP